MGLLLTEKEIEAIQPHDPITFNYPDSQDVARAQLKKVVEWSMEDCDCDVEREHPIHRHFCPRCWQVLLKETE